MNPAGQRSRGWDDFPKAAPRRPGTGAVRTKGRSPFGSTWWGASWVEALEGRARLDPNRLPRGRTYARTGAVGDLVFSVGEITAPVQGSRVKPYQVTVRVRTFSESEWMTVLDALGREIGHVAALFDGELPPGIAEDIASVGLDLLPGAGEIQPRCSCPDWADPCKHSAAVCYLVADEIDRDPFGLLLLRGRGREEVLSALRLRRAGGARGMAGGADPELAIDHGVPARDAWQREPGEVPLPPLPPTHPGRPQVLPAGAPPTSGVDAEALRSLAADAAVRALDLALGGDSSGLELSIEEDLARRAAYTRGSDPTHVPARPRIAGPAGWFDPPGAVTPGTGLAGRWARRPGGTGRVVGPRPGGRRCRAPMPRGRRHCSAQSGDTWE